MTEPERGQSGAATLIAALCCGGILGIPWIRAFLVIYAIWLAGVLWYPLLSVPALIRTWKRGSAADVARFVVLAQVGFLLAVSISTVVYTVEPWRMSLLEVWCSVWFSLAMAPWLLDLARRARPRDAV